MHAKGEITILNYYYIMWTFYFTGQSFITVEFPDVKYLEAVFHFPRILLQEIKILA